MSKIGFGGGCHWCTEAVFQSIKGVEQVEQGWIKAKYPNDSFSEAVIVHYDKALITTKTLIEVHLLTHSSTSTHKMRDKYRSAVYAFTEKERVECQNLINQISKEDNKLYITKALLFDEFRLNDESFLDYYKRNPENAFCNRYISPKLEAIKAQFGKHVKN